MFRQHAQTRRTQQHGGIHQSLYDIEDNGLYGTCSNFYTNNPLLYVTQYSDIGVFENASNDVINVIMDPSSNHVMSDLNPPITHRREAVELLCLDRPLLDYLAQNGVLEEHHLESINPTSPSNARRMTSARRNLAVLRCVDSAGRRGLELLLNALRHTGQHELANMLDNGRRIEPSIEPQQTPQHNVRCTRRRGQVRLSVRVASVKLFNPIELDNSPHNWISVEDLDSRLQVMTSRKPETASRRAPITRHRRPVQLVPDPPSSSAKSTPEIVCVTGGGKKPQLIGRLVTWMTEGWQRGRFARNIAVSENIKYSASQHLSTTTDDIKKRSNGTSKSNGHASTTGHFRLQRNDVNRASVPLHAQSTSGTTEHASRTVRQRQSIDKLRRTIDCVRVAIQEFYSTLTGNTMFGDVSQSRDRLLSYFEAERRILVLDTTVVNAAFPSNASCLLVVIICPTANHLDSLRRDCSSGQLCDDLEQRLLTAELMDELDAEIDAVRLNVQLDLEDLDLAQAEL